MGDETIAQLGRFIRQQSIRANQSSVMDFRFFGRHTDANANFGRLGLRGVRLPRKLAK